MMNVYRHLTKITTYPYGTNAFMVCENEMLLKNKNKESIIMAEVNMKNIAITRNTK